MQIAIHAEHTVQSGRVVIGWDGEDSDDVVVFEGSLEEIRATARLRAQFGRNDYIRRSGRNILDYLEGD